MLIMKDGNFVSADTKVSSPSEQTASSADRKRSFDARSREVLKMATKQDVLQSSTLVLKILGMQEALEPVSV
jgi:hypothetical protein